MGPLELGDLIGLDVCLAIMEVLYNETGEASIVLTPCCARWYVVANWEEKLEKALQVFLKYHSLGLVTSPRKEAIQYGHEFV